MLLAHLSACEPCARHVNELGVMQRLLTDLPLVEPPAHFDWRLRLRLSKALSEAAVPAVAARRSMWNGPLQFATSAAAAAVVVLVVGYAFLRPQPAATPGHSSSGLAPVQTLGGSRLRPVGQGLPIGPAPVAPPQSFFLNDTPSAAAPVPDSSAAVEAGAPAQ
jgi:hypothetical protein